MINIFVQNYAGKWVFMMKVSKELAQKLIETREFPDLWRFEEDKNNEN